METLISNPDSPDPDKQPESEPVITPETEPEMETKTESTPAPALAPAPAPAPGNVKLFIEGEQKAFEQLAEEKETFNPEETAILKEWARELRQRKIDAGLVVTPSDIERAAAVHSEPWQTEDKQ